MKNEDSQIVKVQEGNDQEKAQSERNSHPKSYILKCFVVLYVFSFPPAVYVGTLNLIASIPGPSILTYTKKTYCKPSEQLFPNRWPLSYPILTKNMKTHIRCKQHKNSTPIHNTIRTTTEVSPWKDQ